MIPVLFVHGFPFDHQMWRHQVAALSRWRCIAPDLIGAGRHPPPVSSENYSMAAFANDLIRLLDELKIEQVAACGLSMGGYVLFELLRRARERVCAAILCSTKALADTPEGKRGRDAMMRLTEDEGAPAIAEELIPKVLARATHLRRPDVVREVTEMILRQNVAGIRGALSAMRDRPDSTPLLERIDVPVLVVAGDDDQITPAAGMRSMAAAIPGAKFVLIPEAGHLTPLEQPEAVTEAIRDFLRGKVG
ncbi:MAG: alpha/beta fold hydrolase [Gemmatimonadales bacterium]